MSGEPPTWGRDTLTAKAEAFADRGSDGRPVLKTSKMPGHWLLARLGKRVLRPGGRELTISMLRGLDVGPEDNVVELAPGLGATTELILPEDPASYVGIERDEAAASIIDQLLSGTNQHCKIGSAQNTGLNDESASVVFGEAFLTMQPADQKQKIVDEVFRILEPGGRYGIHELSLEPDDVSETVQADLWADLSRTIKVGAKPLAVPDWRSLLEEAGFVIEAESRAPMHLLEPKRVVQDEGLLRTVRIAFNVIRDREARQRVLGMRRGFRTHQENLGAVALVAVKPVRTAP